MNQITDEILEEEWDNFQTPVNNEGEIEEDYTVGEGKEWQTTWPAGTEREEIWAWYDEKHSIGVYKLVLKTN